MYFNIVKKIIIFIYLSYSQKNIF